MRVTFIRLVREGCVEKIILVVSEMVGAEPCVALKEKRSYIGSGNRNDWVLGEQNVNGAGVCLGTAECTDRKISLRRKLVGKQRAGNSQGLQFSCWKPVEESCGGWGDGSLGRHLLCEREDQPEVTVLALI